MHTTQYSYIATTYNIANYIQHNINNNYTTTQYTLNTYKDWNGRMTSGQKVPVAMSSTKTWLSVENDVLRVLIYTDQS